MRGGATLTAVLWLAAVGCGTSTTITYDVCGPEVTLSLSTAEVGDVVTATGRPQTERTDTTVTVGGALAGVIEVGRTNCFDCDACRGLAQCDACEACTTCAEACATCVEAVSFEIPEVEAGSMPVVITNAYGSSDPAPLEIVPSADSGSN